MELRAARQPTEQAMDCATAAPMSPTWLAQDQRTRGLLPMATPKRRAIICCPEEARGKEARNSDLCAALRGVTSPKHGSGGASAATTASGGLKNPKPGSGSASMATTAESAPVCNSFHVWRPARGFLSLQRKCQTLAASQRRRVENLTWFSGNAPNLRVIRVIRAI